MNIVSSSQAYEDWLKRQVQHVPADFYLKHQKMCESPFFFLRATFFRWCKVWLETQNTLSPSPNVLSVGDIHIENFGTWRDLEGRLIWGINDFDEAYPMPYLFDLIRLAASIMIAGHIDHLRIKPAKVLALLLESYQEGLSHGGSPFILEEKHEWLHQIALKRLKQAPQYWSKLMAATKDSKNISLESKRILRAELPAETTDVRFCHRVAGLGSLGRTRILALGRLDGAFIARETKPLAPSAYAWAKSEKTQRIYYGEILANAKRAQDPFLKFKENWVVRRLSPQCSKIELSSLPDKLDEYRLIESMGIELANVHLGSKNSAAILKDLKTRKPKQLQAIVNEMVESTIRDWKSWKMKRGEK